MATISTHNGTQAHQNHNNRDPRCVNKEPHIDPSREHETWVHEPVKDAYHRLFDEAQQKYNDRQTREDRQIEDYYTKILNDKQKNPCYEMIIGIYGNSDPKTEKEIMRDFVNTWNERNPSLELIGAYYHNDEQGTHHVHIDYIPIVRDCTRGMEIQTGLNGALKEQGFQTHGTRDTAQMQWERAENKYLERLCHERNIEIEHPQSREHTQERIAHLDTLEYKVEQKERELIDRYHEVEKQTREYDRIANYINERQTLVDRTYNYLEKVEEYCHQFGLSQYQYYNHEYWADRGVKEHQAPEILNPERDRQEREQIARELQQERDQERDRDRDRDRDDRGGR